MKPVLVAGAFALFLGLSPSFAQGPNVGPTDTLPDAAEWQTLTDARIDAVKAALQLTPDQAKLWPPVEEAIRARGQGRYIRLEAFMKSSHGDRTVIELLRQRSDALAQRSAELKRLVEAWQPLFQTLDDAQKLRLRAMAVYALREMRDELESRRMQAFDDEESEF